MPESSLAESQPRASAPDHSPALSVVVGSVNARHSIAESLAALQRACDGLDAEVIVVDASNDGTFEAIGAAGSKVCLSRHEPGTLTPRLWSTGLALSSGRVVAFTTAHFLVERSWARALLSGIEAGATGASGFLALAKGTGPVDWAIFYLRYSAFLGRDGADIGAVDEIPGDNAAYRRDALDRHAASFSEGFWEVEFHRLIRPEGARLTFVRGAEAGFRPSASLISFARQRFGHGCHFGAWRVKMRIRRPWQIAAAAPLVPILLTARIARRVLGRRSERGRFLVALPALLVLAAAWAAGEALGALTADPSEG